MKKFWYVFLGTFVCSVVLSPLYRCLGSEALWNRLTNGRSEYLSFFYNFKNATKPFPGDNQELEGIDPHLAVINVSDFCGKKHERADIARLIDTLCQMEPAVVGVDLLFPDSIESSPDDDQMLWDAVGRNRDKLVVAAFYDKAAPQLEDKWVHSFFTEGTAVDFGTVNGQDFYTLSLRDRIDDTTYVDKFITKLASKAGMLPPAQTTDKGIVDYRNRRIDELMIDQERLSRDRIQGKIVLVGEFDDSRDYVNLPFRIEGESYIPGSKLLVYQLCSLLAPGHFIRKAGFWHSFLFDSLFLLLYTFFFVCLSIRENDWVQFEPERKSLSGKNSASLRRNTLRLLMKPVWLAAVSALGIVVSFIILDVSHVMIDLLAFFIAELFFVDFFCKVFTMFYNKRHPKTN